MASSVTMDSTTNQGKIWMGIALGAAVGIGIALSRRKRSRWDAAREFTSRVADHSSNVAEATRAIADRVRHIYDETCQVVQDAGHLWSQRHKVVRR